MLALTACTPPPIYKPVTPPLEIAPDAVAATPERYHDGPILWGGQILDVHNRGDASEIVILAYPLDSGQRPHREQSSQGRFIATLSGYVESYDYPQGRFVTLIGNLAGTRVEAVELHEYTYPLVNVQDIHLWPLGFENDRPQIHFGIGISGGIR